MNNTNDNKCECANCGAAVNIDTIFVVLCDVCENAHDDCDDGGYVDDEEMDAYIEY